MAKKSHTERQATDGNLDDFGLAGHVVEFEEAILGAIMLEKGALLLALSILNRVGEDNIPLCFSSERNKVVFEAIFALYQEDKVIDIKTVTHKVRAMGLIEVVGGASYVAGLTKGIASSAHIEAHCFYLLEVFIRKRLYKLSQKLFNDSQDKTKDVFDLVQLAEDGVVDVQKIFAGKEVQTLNKVLNDTLEETQANIKREGTKVGITTGIRLLDRQIGGWINGNFYLIAARPSMGKSAAMVHFAKEAAKMDRKKVGVFSLEMTNKQLMYRMQSSFLQIVNSSGFYQRITNSELMRGIYHIREGESDSGFEAIKLNDEQFSDIARQSKNYFEGVQMYFDDEPCTIEQLKAKIRVAKAKYGIEVAFIDYVQILGTDKQFPNNNERVGYISRTLKAIAKSEEIPLIVLSQLSRDVEKRGGDKKPQMSDLKDSGSLEQDADVIIMLYRPEYYGITEDADGNPTKDHLDLLTKKNRNGSVGDIGVCYQPPYNYINDWEDEKGQKRVYNIPLPNEIPTTF